MSSHIGARTCFFCGKSTVPGPRRRSSRPVQSCLLTEDFLVSHPNIIDYARHLFEDRQILAEDRICRPCLQRADRFVIAQRIAVEQEAEDLARQQDAISEEYVSSPEQVSTMSNEDQGSLTHVSPVLTTRVLSQALTDWFNELFTFTHWEYVSDTGKGDSYLSDLMRIRIYGNDQHGVSKRVQVILKTMPRSVARRLTFKSHEFFQNEINFYVKVLPALLEFQSKKNLSEPFQGYVKLFYAHSDGINDVICLEDASLENFQSAFRQEGIDLAHCQQTLKSLAQFHAISFAMKDQRPVKFEDMRHNIFEVYYHERLRNWYRRFWKRISGIAIDAVEREYPDSVYVEKVKQFCVPERYDDMIKAATRSENGVISHGDSWTNNFLYKYENGAPVDAKIIDFQLTRCATPVLDVAFFFYACTTQDLRLKHYDELLKLYHDVLSKQIREMDSDPEKVYPWTLFLKEIKKYSYFGLAFSFESTPMIILDPEDALDMEVKGNQKLDIDDVWSIGPIKDKKGRLREADNVVHCVDRGYI